MISKYNKKSYLSFTAEQPRGSYLGLSLGSCSASHSSRSLFNMATPHTYSSRSTQISINMVITSRKLLTPNTQPSTFRGDQKESIDDWIRQFDNYITLYEGFTEQNLNLYVSAFLQSSAGLFYDNLCVKPITWSDFKK
ncbi:Retrotransposon gag protein, partial [Conglomerata obtusa]